MGFDTHILAATRLLNAQPAPLPTHRRMGRATKGQTRRASIYDTLIANLDTTAAS